MDIQYKPELPTRGVPIIILGAGGIVKDAHLPAYKQAGLTVHGIYNRTIEKARRLAAQYDIPNVYDSIEQAVADAPSEVVWDIAVMPPQFVDVLDKLPENSHVLIQKPMGDDWAQTLAIRDKCHEKGHQAAINCQLRFAPFVMATRWLLDQGLLGELHHLEVHVEVYTPWHLFPHIHPLPRVEIQQHSIHYVDLIRSFFGDPENIYARTVKHPKQAELASTRSTIIMDYGDEIQATILTNHGHDFGPHNQQSYIKWEGTKGAVKAKMGLLMNYPDGVPDHFEYCLLNKDAPPKWETVQLEGSWFPEAFVGTMASVQRHLEGTADSMPTNIDDVMRTMACVEAAYESNANGGSKVDYGV
ncbi:Inositol 2-dehydrogenase/D-chiro-inositol 3-dehydrogenase [Planctomycetes bacterium CA13]|uniref:Inositol 2-dehydrogenase/D-chiro-inositol 3-dehydrogenase n=1 Tax=Novipirellula herctigrandis TaxID=2527986 RepID=A0A5C5YNY5_9BACT|nr:Inositol 2-dehydrogenase/D-chiro-inositol 3-dehydrogenase [Planctomycetes bacterium CA13]